MWLTVNLKERGKKWLLPINTASQHLPGGTDKNHEKFYS
jgi:hypothetical protein